MKPLTTILAASIPASLLFLPAVASAQTVYTGDIIQGKQVISQLVVADLESGRKHGFFFQAGQLIDLNRVWPGNEEGGNAPTRHAGLVFNRLFKPNADYALDYHTAATGGDFTAFIFAKLDQPEIRAMAELSSPIHRAACSSPTGPTCRGLPSVMPSSISTACA